MYGFMVMLNSFLADNDVQEAALLHYFDQLIGLRKGTGATAMPSKFPIPPTATAPALPLAYSPSSYGIGPIPSFLPWSES